MFPCPDELFAELPSRALAQAAIIVPSTPDLYAQHRRRVIG